MKLSLSDDELSRLLNDDQEFITIIHDIVNTAPALTTAPIVTTETLSGKTSDNMITPMMHVSGGKIWFTYSDIVGTLTSAAMIGPAAVYAAFVGLGSISLGPVGTAITAAVGVLGFPSLAGFTYSILQASINRQGVYMGVEMNGVFPNIVSGTW